MSVNTEKWIAPAVNSDVAKLVIATRQCMIDLHNAMMATASGRPVEAQDWLEKYREADQALKEVIWEVAGFDKDLL
jgi:cell fate (sporulation/competence/biofilm development) regulator YlbF (YheA/YmcA/DUF963 family)